MSSTPPALIARYGADAAPADADLTPLIEQLLAHRSVRAYLPDPVSDAQLAAIIAAAGGNDIPQAWIDQLAVGGRLVAPAVTAAGKQNLVVVDKTATGTVRTELEAVFFVPLKSGIA